MDEDPPKKATVTQLPQHLGPSRTNAPRRRARRAAEELVREAKEGTPQEITQKLSMSPALLDPAILQTQFDIVKTAQALVRDYLNDPDIQRSERVKIAKEFIPKMSAEITGKLVEATIASMKPAVAPQRSERVTSLLESSRKIVDPTEPEP